MKYFPNNTRLVESTKELPNLTKADRLYLDFETTSGDPKLMSTNPWHNCNITGIGITIDDCDCAWYIPVGCIYEGESKRNLNKEFICGWLHCVVSSAKVWINHNVKYDAHVLFNCAVRPQYRCSLPQLIDTLALAKLIDSDKMYRGGYGLATLSKDWLDEDISSYEDALRPYLKKPGGQYYNKDYGNIPIDTIAPYCGQDVLTVRKLAEYIKDKLPSECSGVMKTECNLTSVLFDMERYGVRIDRQQLEIHQMACYKNMVRLQEELTELLGYYCLASSDKDVADAILNTYGLPVIKQTDKGNPSFDNDTLKEYLYFKDAPTDVIKTIIKYRKWNHFHGLFVEKYLDLEVNSRLHPDINQTVSTGRMSNRSPNMQQLNKAAKTLIHSDPGHMFISIDYSQIEFRLIVHYIQNQGAISAYASDPNTDFHSWIQSKLPPGISRSRAKTINFQTSYGGGKKRMSQCMDLMDDLREVAGYDRRYFLSLCRQRGAQLYDMYHSRFPELKRTAKHYERIVRQIGYTTNLYGRRRHLDHKVAHIAFNTVIQGLAADIMKERLVAVAPVAINMGIHPVIVVHDEVLFSCSKEVGNDPETIPKLVECLESPSIQHKLSVPIRCSVETSDSSWADCKSIKKELQSEYIGSKVLY